MKSATDHTTPRVLVVEDDRSVMRMLHFSLSKAGFEVAEAPMGKEALQVLEQEPLDAVVLDLSLLDGMGGVVLGRLHQLHQQANGLPVWLIISALDREEATRRYGPLGDNFLPKPFNPWDLIDMLHRLLSLKGV